MTTKPSADYVSSLHLVRIILQMNHRVTGMEENSMMQQEQSCMWAED
jgi:hypothetical protein